MKKIHLVALTISLIPLSANDTLPQYGGGGLAMNPPVEPSKEIYVEYMSHLQKIGDINWCRQPEVCGTGAQDRRLEGFAVRIHGTNNSKSIRYMAHLQDVGDTPWTAGDNYVGTRGEGRRLEGFAIKLVGEIASQYDVYYMAHLHKLGNTRWYKNGQFCGTRGKGIPVEAISIFIAEKNAPLRAGWSWVTQTSNINYFQNCDRILNVKGFVYSNFDKRHNIRNTSPAGDLNSDLYLYLVAASVRDDGENAIREPGDIGLHILGGSDFTEEITQTKLYGIVHTGDEANGEHKYEWEDYCSMQYNNFIIMDVSRYREQGIKVLGREGDEGVTADDIVFSAYVRLNEIDSSGKFFSKVEGDCDIRGDCATLYFAIRRGNEGKFWNQ